MRRARFRDFLRSLFFTVAIIADSGGGAPAEGDGAPAEGDAAPAGDGAPAEGDGAPAEGDAAPAAVEPEADPKDKKFQRVLNQSKNKSAKIRELESELARFKASGQGDKSPEQIIKEKDLEIEQLRSANTLGDKREALRKLTDGKDGNVARRHDKVLNLIIEDMTVAGVDMDEAEDFVESWAKENSDFFLPADPGSNAAAEAGAPLEVRRAAQMSTLDPAEELAVYHRKTAAERELIEAEKPGTRQRLKAASMKIITEGARKEGLGGIDIASSLDI